VPNSPVSEALIKKGFHELTPPQRLNFDTERKMSDGGLFELSAGSESLKNSSTFSG